MGVAIATAVVTAASVSADVHLARRSDGSPIIFNDNIGSGWRVNGKAPTDAYLVERRTAPSPYDDLIDLTARSQGIDPLLVKSVMLVESNFNPRAVSRKGARGLMQLMPETARRYGVKNRFDVRESIRGGVRYLADLLMVYRGDLTRALAAYNAGETAVARHDGVPPYAETVEYVRRALVAYRAVAPPLVGGGFRGMPTGPYERVRGAPVKVANLDGTPVLSNVPVAPRPERAAPVLGRVR